MAQTRTAREWSDVELRALADRFAVSREVLLLRLAAPDQAPADYGIPRGLGLIADEVRTLRGAKR